MGNRENIDYDRFPKQGNLLGKRVVVIFHYDFNRRLNGVVVRDDAESPHVNLIMLEDARVVRFEECQFTTVES